MAVTKRTVVVVGCSRGIGLGLLNHFSTLESCSAVVGVVRKDSDRVRLTSEFLANTKVQILCGDVTDLKSMEGVSDAVRRSGLVPDLLICNAGVLTFPKPFNDIPTEDMVSSFEVNVLGPFHTMQAFLPLMRAVPGAVMVNVSSGWGLRGEAGESTYCMSKHALEGLVKCAALDVAADPLSIVTVRPGMVFTEMLAAACHGDAELAKQKGLPVERLAPHFCEMVMAITKADSGTHIDCGYRGPVDW